MVNAALLVGILGILLRKKLVVHAARGGGEPMENGDANPGRDGRNQVDG